MIEFMCIVEAFIVALGITTILVTGVALIYKLLEKIFSDEL